MSNALSFSADARPLRLCAASPGIVLGDVKKNTRAIIEAIRRAESLEADYLALPELCLTGATLGPLYEQPLLLSAAQEALREICMAVRNTHVLAAVGLPYMIGGKAKSCAALIGNGRVRAILPAGAGTTPFGFLPQLDYSGGSAALTPVPRLRVHFGNALFHEPDPQPGNIVLMPSALNATAKSQRQVQCALKAYSARTGAAIAYAAPNMGESGSCFLFDGICAIAVQGEILAESAPDSTDAFVHADVYPETLTAFEPFLPLPDEKETYLSNDLGVAAEECRRILALQAAALTRRLTHIGGKGFVVGVSGGLDSTLALLASVAAAERMHMDPACVLAVSMPGFGTTNRTRNNARALSQALGCSFREIPITSACIQHFSDIGHDINDHSVVYENAQARERTQILLSLANKEGLLNVGTGDLSEAALGFTTFCGDHMAQYGINATIPKTVIRKVVAQAKGRFPAAAAVLHDILNTPISPELLPPKEGQMAQKTEVLLGDYELHDFFLYHMTVNHLGPRRLYELASERLPYTREEIHRALGIFLTRFFAQQYKRSCAPESPLILLSLSSALFPMPSDMAAVVWMQEYARIKVNAD